MAQEKFIGWYSLLVVVAAIAIISGVAVPAILTSRMSCFENEVIEFCKNLQEAEKIYADQNEGKFADIEALLKGNYLDSRFSHCCPGYFFHRSFFKKGNEDGKKSEYVFELRPRPGQGRYIFEVSSYHGLRYLGSVSVKYEHPKYKPGSVIYP